MKKNKIKNFMLLFFKCFYQTIRSLLGTKGVCIYHVSCSEYAKIQLKQKPFYLALPLITLRVISCNPLTGLIKKFINY